MYKEKKNSFGAFGETLKVYYDMFKPSETVAPKRYKIQLQCLNKQFFIGKCSKPIKLLHDKFKPHTTKTTKTFCIC